MGAGLFGLYSAKYCGRREKVLVLEYDNAACMRATYVNQARIHMGYHYPRSYTTAMKSAEYFQQFVNDFGFCANTQFDQIYATSSAFSWTNSEQFHKFCRSANIQCDAVNPSKYFKDNMCDGAFLTKEYAFDTPILKTHLLKEIAANSNIKIVYGARIKKIEQLLTHFVIELENGQTYSTDFLLNATYASINQILKRLEYPLFKIKYELCEIILCNVNDKLKKSGITVMDGPFFSIMPFGKTAYHSLTSVTFTPHITSHECVPTFDCQLESGGYCSPSQLGNCNHCNFKPQSAWGYMSVLAKKYLLDEFKFEYVSSLYSIKPTLVASEVDDSRPTLIRQFSSNPTLVSVLSGKINTLYDLEEILDRC